MFNHMTMTESAALELRKAILRGDYPPGTRLVPARLEADLNLSKTAIREAIRELVGTGLAYSLTHKGACVAHPLDLEEIRDIFDIRFQLEGKAAYKGSQVISQEEIERMEVLLEEMSKPKQGNRLYDFLLNQQFHTILYRACNWQYLIKVIDRMFDQVLAFRSSLYHWFSQDEINRLFTWDTFREYHEDHIQIVELIRARNPNGVREAVVKNLKRGLSGLEEMFAFLENR